MNFNVGLEQRSPHVSTGHCAGEWLDPLKNLPLLFLGEHSYISPQGTAAGMEEQVDYVMCKARMRLVGGSEGCPECQESKW